MIKLRGWDIVCVIIGIVFSFILFWDISDNNPRACADSSINFRTINQAILEEEKKQTEALQEIVRILKYKTTFNQR